MTYQIEFKLKCCTEGKKPIWIFVIFLLYFVDMARKQFFYSTTFFIIKYFFKDLPALRQVQVRLSFHIVYVTLGTILKLCCSQFFRILNHIYSSMSFSQRFFETLFLGTALDRQVQTRHLLRRVLKLLPQELIFHPTIAKKLIAEGILVLKFLFGRL